MAPHATDDGNNMSTEAPMTNGETPSSKALSVRAFAFLHAHHNGKHFCLPVGCCCEKRLPNGPLCCDPASIASHHEVSTPLETAIYPDQ
jgi:hypothetical protein